MKPEPLMPSLKREIAGWHRGTALNIHLDGKTAVAYPGETIAGAMWRLGDPTCRLSELQAEPRGYFCGMGACFECAVIVDGIRGVRACLTPVHDGMRIERMKGRREVGEG